VGGYSWAPRPTARDGAGWSRSSSGGEQSAHEVPDEEDEELSAMEGGGDVMAVLGGLALESLPEDVSELLGWQVVNVFDMELVGEVVEVLNMVSPAHGDLDAAPMRLLRVAKNVCPRLGWGFCGRRGRAQRWWHGMTKLTCWLAPNTRHELRGASALALLVALTLPLKGLKGRRASLQLRGLCSQHHA
jgi:hypothetical protein